MQVVVALQRHQVAPGKGLVHRGRQHAKVGGDGHGLAVRGVDAVTHTGHIMAGGERLHPKCAHVLFPALQRVQFTAGRHDAIGIQKIQRVGRAVHRQRVLFEEGGQPLDVVAVLMSDQNAVAVADGKAQRLERCRGGAHPLAHVHDQVPAAAAHHAAVAGRAGIQ